MRSSPARLLICAGAALAACGGDKRRSGPPVERDAAAPAAPLVSPPEPLPAYPDGTIGMPGPTRVFDAADDGSWIALCQVEPGTPHPRIVLGAGGGFTVDRLLVTTPRDLIGTRGGELLHVDVVAHTQRRLGPVAPVAVDPGSRRIVVARGEELVILDPGVAPRRLPAGGPVTLVWLRAARWAEVEHGAPPTDLAGQDCNRYVPSTRYGPRATVDLDPSGIEAADRVGPEIGITGGGEVTLDGEVVIGADCVARVVAALATPPRVLAMCGHGPNLVAGPGGWRKPVDGNMGSVRSEQATIDDYLRLGTRLICVNGACIDLLTGEDFSTYSNEVVWLDADTLVRKQDGGLLIDQLPVDPAGTSTQRSLALPRITQAVTVDSVTGRRRAGTAPPAAAFIDAAGRWLLYGRYVIDVHDGVLVATLGDDALAIDGTGRVLVGASPGTGPLRWVKP